MRIILVGPSASGKSFLRKRLEEKGLVFDVSYTSRPPRSGEINKVHYKFLAKDTFEADIRDEAFYEWVEYNGNYYGTGNFEWNTCGAFIMETDGIKHIKPEDRKDCFVIYLNPPRILRTIRMQERGWSGLEIEKRLKTDEEKFKDFSDYDMIVTNGDF